MAGSATNQNSDAPFWICLAEALGGWTPSRLQLWLLLAAPYAALRTTRPAAAEESLVTGLDVGVEWCGKFLKLRQQKEGNVWLAYNLRFLKQNAHYDPFFSGFLTEELDGQSLERYQGQCIPHINSLRNPSYRSSFDAFFGLFSENCIDHFLGIGQSSG